jgi:hypothetical protein
MAYGYTPAATDYATLEESVNGGAYRQVDKWTDPPTEIFHTGLGQGYAPAVTGDEPEITWVYRLSFFTQAGLLIGAVTSNPFVRRAIPLGVVSSG